LPTGAPEPTIAKVLAGQKALVTGANSDIGQAAAIALGQGGADVVVYVTAEDAAQAQSVVVTPTTPPRKAGSCW
jgi:glucose 1-dehydrogenase